MYVVGRRHDAIIIIFIKSPDYYQTIELFVAAIISFGLPLEEMVHVHWSTAKCGSNNNVGEGNASGMNFAAVVTT